MQRRAFVSLLGTAATGVAASPATPFSLHPGAISRTARMVAGCQRAPTDDRALQFFKRHGVSHICGYPPDEARIAAWTVDALTRFRERCQAQGVSLDMVQIPFLSSATIDQNGRKGIMLAREPERQQEIDEACTIVRHCAAAGIPAIKYNMNLLGVLRTAPTDGRGGSRYSTWRLADAREAPALTAAGPVPADEAWSRITYFLERVVPVATEHKVRLACHPHDPGVAPAGFRGIARVLGTVDGLKRFVEIAPSEYHGLNLCLGSVAEMLQTPAEEIHDVIRYFGTRKKIFNVHFRNIRGRRDAFQEVFPDEGDMRMPDVIRTLHDVGYPYMVMPDHMPAHPDDPGQHQAFAFGYGYITGLIQSLAPAAV